MTELKTLPAAPRPAPPNDEALPLSGGFKIGKAKRKPERVVLYGTSGIGKTCLAALASRPVFIDLEDSTGTLGLDVPTIKPAEGWTWKTMLDALDTKSAWDAFDTVVIDTLSKAEDLCAAHVCATIRGKGGIKVDRIEDYGYGSGYSYMYDMFLGLLAKLEEHRDQGRHIILVCHDCTQEVPNPQGVDYIRYEPRLQSPKAGKNSVRFRVREWCDDLLFVGYDLNVSKEGKAQGCGSRTVYPQEQPHCMAKSRTLKQPLVYQPGDDSLWKSLGMK
jgi:hypothetical protein